MDVAGTEYPAIGYGADPTGQRDSTGALQSAATLHGEIILPAGTFRVGPGLIAEAAAGASFRIRGTGVDRTLLTVPDGAMTTQGMLLSCAGAGTFDIDGLTIDANGAGQDWSAATASSYYQIISGSGNGNGTAGTLLIGTVKVVGAQMTTAVPQGIAVNTFGFPDWNIDRLITEDTDTSLFITQAFTNTPNRGRFGSVEAHNPTSMVVYAEGFGGWHGDQIIALCDALTAGDQPVDALVYETTNPISNTSVGLVVLANGRYPINIGNGNSDLVSDTVIGRALAIGCRGSYNLRQVGDAVSFGQLIADGCAIGGITGTTVFGAFELGYSGGSPFTIGELVSINSQNQAAAFSGPAIVGGGRVTGSKISPPIAFPLPAGSSIRGVAGVNPADVATPAVPAASTAVTNSTGVDCDVYIAGGTAVAVTINGTATGQAAGTFFVPAGGTIDLGAYTAAPTWEWVGR